MSDKVTIVIEAKTTAEAAAAKAAQLDGLLWMFLGEIGAEGHEIEGRIDSYMVADEIVAEGGWVAPGDVRVHSECRVQARATVEMGS